MQIERHQAFLARDARRATLEQIKVNEAVRIDAESRQLREAVEQIQKSKEPIQVEGDRAYIKQRIYIARKFGKGVIEDVQPCNDDVRSYIALRHENPVVPTEVIRYYIFCGNSCVSPDYEHLLPNEEMRDAIDPEIKVSMSFAEFREKAAYEDANKLHPEEWTDVDD